MLGENEFDVIFLSIEVILRVHALIVNTLPQIISPASFPPTQPLVLVAVATLHVTPRDSTWLPMTPSKLPVSTCILHYLCLDSLLRPCGSWPHLCQALLGSHLPSLRYLKLHSTPLLTPPYLFCLSFVLGHLQVCHMSYLFTNIFGCESVFIKTQAPKS